MMTAEDAVALGRFFSKLLFAKNSLLAQKRSFRVLKFDFQKHMRVNSIARVFNLDLMLILLCVVAQWRSVTRDLICDLWCIYA